MQAVDHRLRVLEAALDRTPTTCRCLFCVWTTGSRTMARREYSDEIKAQVMAWKCDGYCLLACGATIQIAISTLGAPSIHLRTGSLRTCMQ